MYQVISKATDLPSKKLDIPGVTQTVLYEDNATGASLSIITMNGKVDVPSHFHSHADETIYVLEGAFIEDGKTYGPGIMLSVSAGTPHGPQGTETGCKLLMLHSKVADFNLATN